MTETLVRLFVKNSRDTTDPAVRTAYGNLASWVGIFCNLLLCAGKFLAQGHLFSAFRVGEAFGGAAFAGQFADAVKFLLFHGSFPFRPRARRAFRLL